MTDQLPTPPGPTFEELLDSLSNKERVFVEYYLMIWDGAKAARLAGYAKNSAAQQASRLLRNDNVQAVIRARIEQLKMGADEVLLGLADQARGSLDEFISEKGEIDIEQARKAGKMHLLKKYKKIRRYFRGDLTEESVEIEIHDPQAARVWVGKHHKLFTEKHEIGGKDGGAIPVRMIEVVKDYGDPTQEDIDD